jgi:hypothetical protein
LNLQPARGGALGLAESKHWKLVTALGHSLLIAASVGFLLAWLVILILVER